MNKFTFLKTPQFWIELLIAITLTVGGVYFGVNMAVDKICSNFSGGDLTITGGSGGGAEIIGGSYSGGNVSNNCS